MGESRAAAACSPTLAAFSHTRRRVLCFPPSSPPQKSPALKRVAARRLLPARHCGANSANFIAICIIQLPQNTNLCSSFVTHPYLWLFTLYFALCTLHYLLSLTQYSALSTQYFSATLLPSSRAVPPESHAEGGLPSASA